MSQFSIYTTGGKLVEGGSSKDTVESNLIEELGVIPPWQACYCDPETGILIHLFTAKKRDSGSATRKANNYYGVYTDTEASQTELFHSLANKLTGQFENETTGWERVSSKDHLKSQLSDPSQIAAVTRPERQSITLGEQGFVSLLEKPDNQLRLSFDCIEAFRECVGLAISSETGIRYATELKSMNSETTPLLVEYGDALEMPDQTACLLSNQFDEVARSRRNQHINRVENSLRSFDKAINTEAVDVLTAIDALERLTSALTEGESLTRLTFDNPTLSDITTAIKSQWSTITKESAPDVFDKFQQLDSYKPDYKRECKQKLLRLLQSKIDSLETTHLD